jgi:hypothetical protein
MTIEDQVKDQGILYLDGLISSMPTTQASTGWRAYKGQTKKGIALVMHYEGTPANKSCTDVYHNRTDAKQALSWQIQESLAGRYPEFYTVAKFIEQL